jgi:hypothetical protein
MERLPQQLYNLNEWLLLRLFRVFTGLKLAFNPDLEQIYLVPIDDIDDAQIDLVQNQISEEFGLQVDLLHEKVDYEKIIRGNFISTTRLALKFEREITRDKSIALIGISNYWLAPTTLLISRFIHRIYPILGITYMVLGISFLTTLKGKITPDYLEFAAIHEVGHLMGKHGYPLHLFQKKKKTNASPSNGGSVA